MEYRSIHAMTLASLGWDTFFEESFLPFRNRALRPARVAIQHRNSYVVYSELGELRSEVTGRMEYFASGPSDLPVVGDWVVIAPRQSEGSATIVDLLPRKTKFSRKIAGANHQEQVLASNVDRVFIVSGLDGDFNLRRLERYLVVSAESGAEPVIVLNKADLRHDVQEIRTIMKDVAGPAPILFTSALKGKNLERLLEFLPRGMTGALLGSSGAGKTTIINYLLGSQDRKTQPVREQDSRGRHTTSYRELILLPSGGLLIDTPGLRELQLWGGASGVGETFRDIEELAAQCRFRDCTHRAEPGCAVQEALEAGTLDPGRFASYKKLLKEVAYQNRKHDPAAQRQEKDRIKKIMIAYRRKPKKGRP